MENWRVVIVVMMIGWLSSLFVMGNPELHKVGDSKGWNQNVNYTEWSSQQHVYVGDWLLFKFDKRYYNVLEVNKTSYENCIDRDFIKNVTRGGRDVVQMTEAKTYYFISGGGYCFHGMKVSVNVEEHHEIAPSPSPSASHAASLLPCIRVFVANVLYVTLLSILLAIM